MKRVWQASARLLAGLLVTAMYAMPQAYTVSAKPGGLNYIEGQAYIDGSPISDKGLRSTFLNANQTLSTDTGKAEILLTPGVFLRIGDDSAVRMISPSLTDTKVEVKRGEAMIEAAGLLKDNNIQVLDHGATITLAKNGLYRFNADSTPTAAVLDGKAMVQVGEKKIHLKKGRETVLSEALKAEKFDKKKEDDLYAWSNVRSQYVAAASYQAANSMSAYNDNGFAYGYGGWYGPGWYWNNGFNSWAWLPGSGAFYSPFGWGFYSPSAVVYAPIVTGPVYRGGHWEHGHGDGHGNQDHRHWNGGSGTRAAVPINPQRPPAAGVVAGSPAANQAARSAAARSFGNSGFHTATGAPAATFSGNRVTAVSPGAGARSSGPATRSGGPPAGGGMHTAPHVSNSPAGGGAHTPSPRGR
jgi:hypothetical protein